MTQKSYIHHFSCKYIIDGKYVPKYKSVKPSYSYKKQYGFIQKQIILDHKEPTKRDIVKCISKYTKPSDKVLRAELLYIYNDDEKWLDFLE